MGFKKLRKYFSPLGEDSLAALKLPPVRIGLRTKFNVLALGLVAITAIATSGFYLARLWYDEDQDLGARGAAIATMLAAISERGFYPADDAHTQRILDSLGADPDVAYVSVQDARHNVLTERHYRALGAGDAVPRLAADFSLPALGATRTFDLTFGNRRYVETIATATEPAPPRAGAAPVGAGAAPVGAGAQRDPPPASAPAGTTVYVRVGMVSGRTWHQFSSQFAGALTVVAIVLLAAFGATLAVTRRLTLPMRQLMRAAKAVGSGKLDVHVPVRSSDELGLLTHTFNHMTQRLAHAQGEVASYQRTLEDKVAQRTKQLEIASAQAYRLAQHDILTGLPNRSLLNQQLAQLLAQARRDGHHVACLFLDFDHFKRINDTLGHEAGDLLLQLIAERLSGAVRESDVLARLGGDEFVVILPGLDPAHVTYETMTVLSRIRESLLAPFKLADQLPTLTCSIGVSMYPIDADEPGNLIKQADTAMYAAKDAGRNAYRFYTTDMNARVQARLQLETDMRRGMVANEFFLVYQPQVDMKTGRATGVEALLRWRDPTRGIVAPTEFIPVAEESGMIQALGARALRDACRQVKAWHREDMPVRLSVNLSVQQLQHDRWLSIVGDALRASGLQPKYLDLEITESVIITHPEKAVATLVKLKDMGVSMTVDDFGTGYSSLSYLARLPLHAVKIDQRFVRGLGQNRSDETITQAIIALSHSLGLRVVAEGVETDGQFNFLKRHGCNEAQGYLISRPLEAAQLRAWWRLQADELRDADRRTGLA
jgi:diguanylate cyclase (GGDEF)-like protein